MPLLTQEIREAVLRELERIVGPQAFATWGRRFEFQEVEEGHVRIPVPNTFWLEWAEQSFRKPLEEAFRRATGRMPHLAFEVSPTPLFESPWPEPVPDAAPASAAPAPPERTPARGPDAVPARDVGLPLNSHYTFDHFVIGPTNRLAHAASMAVSENPAKIYNPLFLHGAVGLGKTHLLQAICHSLGRRQPHLQVRYLSCEHFVNEYIYGVQKGTLESFRGRYRHVDVLLIDDIHFLAGKEGSQEEFFHTFNALYNAQKQIILSSDSPPKDIPTLAERLTSRFEWGFVARLDAPTFETRMAILRRKAETLGLAVADDVLSFVASNVQTNIRELEGAITKVAGHATLTHRPISLDLAKEALQETLAVRLAPVSVADIQQIVGAYYAVKLSDLQSRKRSRSISLPRQAAIYLARTFTHHSLEEIGAFFGGKDHTTIMYSIDKIERLCQEDPKLKADIEHLSSELRHRL